MTLVDVQNQKNTGGFVGSNSNTNIRIAYPQTRSLPSLPGSPFWRKYKRPITLGIDFPLPYHGFSSTSSDKDGTYTFRSDKPLPKVIANFPVILRQRVDLRAVPMTFMLPVQNKAPEKSAP